MAAYDQGPLSKYNSLTDKHLVTYFNNDRMRKHLVRSGLITKYGEVIPDAVYRVKIARREHRKKVRDMIAQAIIHKALEMERGRQIDIRKKIEEIAKLELVKRVKAGCSRIGDEDYTSYFQAGNMEVKETKRIERSMTELEDMRLPVTPDDESRRRLRRSLPQEEIETKHLSQLDSLTLHEYAKLVERHDRQRISRLPYLGMGNENTMQRPPRKKPGKKLRALKNRPVTASDNRRNEAISTDEEVLEKDSALTTARGGPAKPVTLCQVSFLFHAPAPGRKFSVLVEQQPSGANTLVIFNGEIEDNSIFKLISKRHKGYPFSLTFFIDNVKDSRISTCCEYRHKAGMRVGGPKGHFSLFEVSGDGPCYRCLAENDIKEKKSKTKQRQRGMALSHNVTLSSVNVSHWISANYPAYLAQCYEERSSTSNSVVTTTRQTRAHHHRYSRDYIPLRPISSVLMPHVSFCSKSADCQENTHETVSVKSSEGKYGESADEFDSMSDDQQERDAARDNEVAGCINSQGSSRGSSRGSSFIIEVPIDEEGKKDFTQSEHSDNEEGEAEPVKEPRPEGEVEPMQMRAGAEPNMSKPLHNDNEPQTNVDYNTNNNAAVEDGPRRNGEDESNQDGAAVSSSIVVGSRRPDKPAPVRQQNTASSVGLVIRSGVDQPEPSTSQGPSEKLSSPKVVEKIVSDGRRKNLSSGSGNAEASYIGEKAELAKGDEKVDEDIEMKNNVVTSPRRGIEEVEEVCTKKSSENNVSEDSSTLSSEYKPAPIVMTPLKNEEDDEEDSTTSSGIVSVGNKINTARKNSRNSSSSDGGLNQTIKVVASNDEDEDDDEEKASLLQSSQQRNKPVRVGVDEDSSSSVVSSGSSDSTWTPRGASQGLSNSYQRPQTAGVVPPLRLQEPLVEAPIQHEMQPIDAVQMQQTQVQFEPPPEPPLPNRPQSMCSSSGSSTSGSGSTSEQSDTGRSPRTQSLPLPQTNGKSSDLIHSDKDHQSQVPIKHQAVQQASDNSSDESQSDRVLKEPVPKQQQAGQPASDNSSVEFHSDSDHQTPIPTQQQTGQPASDNSIEESHSDSDHQTPIPTQQQTGQPASDNSSEESHSNRNLKDPVLKQQAVQQPSDNSDDEGCLDVFIQDDDISFKKAKEICARFGEGGRLVRSLTVRNCELESYIFDFISSKLTGHSELESIYLSNCEIEISLLRILARCLPAWTSLHTLVLSHNQLTDYSLQNVVDSLRSTFSSSSERTLRLLDVSHCGLQQSDFSQLIDLLLVDSRVDQLDLSGNSLNDTQWQALLTAMKTNTFTKTVILKECGIIPEMYDEVEDLQLKKRITI